MPAAAPAAPAPKPLGPTVQPRKPRPLVFVNKKRAYLGTGRRKTSVARVFLTEGTGKITVNGRDVNVYFTEVKDRNAVVGPMQILDLAGRLDATITVKGGGITGQGGACSQGVARAVKAMFGLDTVKPAAPAAEGAAPDAAEDATASMSQKLRASGYLTRDGRMKERKKYGRKGARKSFQFSKR